MATSVLDVGPFVLDTMETVILTVPANHDYNVNVIRFGNMDSVDRTVTIYRYTPPNTTDTLGSIVLKNFVIPPKSMYEYGPDILDAGRVLSATCDEAGSSGEIITVHVSGWDHS